MSLSEAGNSETGISTTRSSKCSVNLSVTFQSDQLATVAKNAIDADQVPNPELITRIIEIDGDKLQVCIECEDLFKLRTSLNNYIDFPSSTTSEEQTLLKKYEKLERKRKSLEKAAKPEPEVVATTNNKPLEAKDAKKVIEKLKKTGQLPQIIINTGRKSVFKRKIPQRSGTSSASKPNVADESREVVSYDDDLFS